MVKVDRSVSSLIPQSSAIQSRSKAKGFTLVELLLVVAVSAILMSLGPALLINITRFYRLQIARANIQKSARICIDRVSRLLRQASATSVVITQRAGQPPNSWLTFTIDQGEGALVGDYGIYQEGANLKFMKNGSTSTIADNLRYIAFSYPRSDNDGIISVSMTFEEATFEGHSKALQLSVEKVRVMND
ncbi:MAG: prepilin-type N-terminal cleavage/methylation domain-containing protein [Elusimicrobia bacterium]|nr:prepilin-type N-terminal cleavage/methylation domain-containing protein [Elusimicrobiota bacterium]